MIQWQCSAAHAARAKKLFRATLSSFIIRTSLINRFVSSSSWTSNIRFTTTFEASSPALTLNTDRKTSPKLSLPICFSMLSLLQSNRDALGCQSHHVLSTKELWYSEWCRHGVTPKKDKFRRFATDVSTLSWKAARGRINTKEI